MSPTINYSITTITDLGFWLIINDKEYFVPFKHYPAFKTAKLNEIFAVKLISPSQLHWEDMDCDIELAALENPSQFPLQFKSTR